MRGVRVWIILFGVGLGVVAYARGPQLIPVTNPTQRLESDVLSILPPQGENWFIVRKPQGAGGLVFQFFRSTTPPSKTRTVLANVQVLRGRDFIPAESRAGFLQELAQFKYSEQTNRERPISVTISPDKTLAQDCVRYDVTHEDRGVPRYRGSVFIWDAHGFICVHPDLADTVVDIQYSQRRLQEEPPLSLAGEGEPFVKSVLFKKRKE